jgi:hypothetical protein
MASAELVFKQGEPVTLKKPVYMSNNALANSSTNCTLLVTAPDEDIVTSNVPMINNAGVFQYGINGSLINQSGSYSAYMSCVSGSDYGFKSFSFLVTPSGTEPSTSQGVMYSIILIVVVILFILSVLGGVSIDNKHVYDVGGKLVEINYSGHLRFVLFFVSYLLLIFIVFLAHQITLNFFTLGFAAAVLSTINIFLWALLAPVFVTVVIMMFVKWMLDLKLEKLSIRNLKPRDGGKR